MSNSGLKKVRKISHPFGTEVLRKRDLKGLAETPLLKACYSLYDKGIQTAETSANEDDVRNGYAVISVDYETLSKKNRAIADAKFGSYMREGKKYVEIKIPIGPTTRPKEIETESLKIAAVFEKQALLGVKSYTFEQLCDSCGVDPRTVKRESFKGEYYYDSVEDRYYLSKSQFLRSRRRK